jgi:tetratricopeptide (TPR) repeat protein
MRQIWNSRISFALAFSSAFFPTFAPLLNDTLYMAIKRKLEKKSEDTLLDLSQAKQQATSFFDRNQKMIVGILGGLLLIVGGWFGYRNLIQLPKEQKAMSQMWRAQMQFEQDSFQMALENPGGGYLGFLQITKEFGGTKAGNLANYYAAICYLNLGNFDAALSFLQDFKPDGIVGPTLKYGSLGDVYSELNQMDKAMESYRKSAEASDNQLLTPYYLKKLALLHEMQNETDKALEIYRRIKSDYPNSNEALSIDKYIARAEMR